MYYFLETAGVVAALLLARDTRLGWLLSLGWPPGPSRATCSPRGPGLPNYDDDVGNCAEPLGDHQSRCRGPLTDLRCNVPADIPPPLWITWSALINL